MITLWLAATAAVSVDAYYNYYDAWPTYYNYYDASPTYDYDDPLFACSLTGCPSPER
jgi:hypothetical protein